jgi:PhnB protein
MPSFKPEGYPSISPYLIVKGASDTIEFLKRAFDAQELRRFPDDAGRLMHAEVRIDDSVIMLGDGGEGWPPIGGHVHIYVADVDATYRRALEAGAESVQEPVRKDDADKRGGVKDVGGTTWWIATMVG